MKITLIGPVPPFRGGISHYTYILYRELCTHGHEVQLVSFKRQYPNWLYPGESDRSPGQEDVLVEGARYWIDSLNPFTWLSTFRRIRKFRPAKLIIPWWTPFWAPTWIVFGLLNHLFMKADLVYHCHNVLPHEAKRWHSWIVRMVLGWGNRFVVASSQQAHELGDLLPKAITCVCPLPTNSLLADTCADRESSRTQLGIVPGQKVILFFGIVRAYKGLHVLLDAFSEVRRIIPDVRLMVAGEFWEAQTDYEQHIQELKLTSCVSIHNGYIPDNEVPIYFSAADVLAVPYLSVTGSAVANMARPFDVPVVTTWEQSDLSSGAIPVYVALPGDVQSLADALIAALTEDSNSTAVNSNNTDQEESWDALVDALLGDAPCA